MSLLVAELRRVRTPLVVATAVHALVLAAWSYGDTPFRATEARWIAAAFVYALAGVVVGVHQIASFRRCWTFLLHRPIAPPRLFAALAGAAAIVLGVAVAVPLAVAALAAPGWALLVAPYAWGVAVAFYLAAATVALRPWRGAFLAVAPVLLLVIPTRLGAWVFLPLGLAVVWLAALAGAALRPDLGTPPRGRLAAACAVVPALHVLFLAGGFALLFVYSLSVAFAEMGWRGPARFGWNDYFPAGSVQRVGYLEPAEALQQAWPAQVLGEVVEIAPDRHLGPRSPVVRAGAVSLRPRDLRVDPGLVVPIDGPADDLERALVARVDGGWLISFIFGTRSPRGFTDARQSVWFVGDGRRQKLADRPLTQGPPAWVRHRGFLLSPLLQATQDLVAWPLYGEGAPPDELASSPPAGIVVAAVVIALLSALLTWFLARGLGARRAWALAALLGGPCVPLALPLFRR